MQKNQRILNTATFKIGVFILLFFCALRPITLIKMDFGIVGFSILELFAITISYLLMIFVLFNIGKLKYDLTSLLIILFCTYCVFSVLWGSQVRVVSQIVLPFVIYFSTRIFVTNQKEVNLMVTILIVSYLIPVFGSFYEILRGVSVSQVDYITGLERYSGLFSKIHIMAGALFFFTAFYYIKAITIGVTKRYAQYALFLMLLVSFYCIFKSYARSILIGTFLLWSFCLLGLNKKYFFLFLFVSLIVLILNIDFLQQLLFKTNEIQIKTASSGRSTIWAHNIGLFLRYSFYEKMLGRGLGVGSNHVFGQDWEIWSSHNDYLHLLMQTGVIGLSIYLLIHFAVIKSVFTANIEIKMKFFYAGMIVSIVFMNFVTGVITYSLPTAQFFWMIIGLMDSFEGEKKNVAIKNSHLSKDHIVFGTNQTN